jgi:hypothetical protein
VTGLVYRLLRLEAGVNLGSATGKFLPLLSLSFPRKTMDTGFCLPGPWQAPWE